MSIRQRFFLGLMPGLLFILILGSVSHFALQSVVTRSETVEQAFREHDVAMQLQLTVQQAIMPPNDYLITGDPTERSHFTALATQVEEHFSTLEALIGETETGRALLNDTLGEWQQVYALAESILALPDPVGNPEGAALMEEMDALAHELTGDFNELHQQHEMQIVTAEAAAHATQRHANLALLLGSTLALLGGLA